ncbi:protein FAM187B isoform X1 [Bos javanicus]|uniref:protein FAM187B isoform X1 n=1 Tax=Bos javanicus TaxID=9906 RepID=UPI002AA9397D|nr:protein FAM187B isoform X1 [Bos javanicus]
MDDLTKSRVGPSPLSQSQSTMLTTLWLLLCFALPVHESPFPISCPNHKHCQLALLSNNDIILHCNAPGAQWQFLTPLKTTWANNSTTNLNMVTMLNGNLLIKNPLPSHTGIYNCNDKDGKKVMRYEIDFQDVVTLHITHKDLDQKPLQNESLSLSSKQFVFTHWEPWQDCNRCGEPGERKRLGYCYIQESLENPMPCWLYLGDEKLWSSRLRPEMQVETCHIPCTLIDAKYVIFDNFQLRNKVGSAWLTCPLGSIYRPVLWEANNFSLTWKDQLSGKSISTIMDSSNGGSWLQVFQSAIYRCFVQQELMAQFNSKVSVDPLKFLVPEKSKQQPEAEKTRKENASSVLKGLNVMMLVGTVLTVLGCLFKQFRFSQSRKRNKMFLVK